MAEAILGPLVGKVQELALSEVEALVAVNKQIRELRHQLVWLQAFIRQADPRRRTEVNELIVAWVQQTRNVAFEVEDAVDKYLLRVDLSRYPSWTRATMKLVTGIVTQISVRHDLCTRISSIKEKIEEISKNKKEYRLDDATSSSPAGWSSSTSSAYTAWDDLETSPIGCDDELKCITDNLFKKDHRLTVFSIIGESGTGKTKLARTVYDDLKTKTKLTKTVDCDDLKTKTKLAKTVEDDDLKTKKHFDICSWMTLTPYLGISEILQFISKRLPQKKTDKVLVRDKLYEQLTGKKYLLVLDGVVSVTDWNAILDILPDDKNGSSVILITSFEAKALPCANHDIHPVTLKLLNEGKSMELFCQRVFGNNSKRSLTDYEKDIFEVTGGLPIAIVVLSGLLRTKEFQDEWKAVLKHLKENKKSKRLQRILSLSFDDLPHQLKSCFLYLAAMPENKLIDANKVVRLWTAEGFITSRKGKTMEEVGQEYLKELISRGLLQLDRKDAHGGVQSVLVHECLLAFVQSEAKEANFMEVHDNDDVIHPTSVRRLSLQNYIDKYVPLTNSFPKLRSILCDFEEQIEDSRASGRTEPPRHQFPQKLGNCLGELIPCITCHSSNKEANTTTKLQVHTLKFLEKSEFLRVLNLQGLRIIETLPNAIGKLIHLRYLGIKCASLKKLPASIRKLVNLQTLDLQGTSVCELPEEFWKILTLRHVLGDSLVLPSRVEKLQHLQTLDGVRPSEDSHWNEETPCPLENMVHLRSLKINQDLKDDHAKGLSDALDKLEFLRHLILKGQTLPSGIFTKSALQRLQVMELEGELVSPMATGFILPNLTHLKLHLSEVRSQDFMDKLAKLPVLTELVLMRFSYMGEKLVFRSGGFPSLSKVELNNLDKLKMVVVEEFALLKVDSFVISTKSKQTQDVLFYADQKILSLVQFEGPKLTITAKHVSEYFED